jgi:hypothetical protein
VYPESLVNTIGRFGKVMGIIEHDHQIGQCREGPGKENEQGIVEKCIAF